MVVAGLNSSPVLIISKLKMGVAGVKRRKSQVRIAKETYSCFGVLLNWPGVARRCGRGFRPS